MIHVPLSIRFPGLPPKVPEVRAQVRLMDVSQSVLDGAGFEPLAESEGVPLIAYGTGFRKATISCGLVGRDLDGDWLLGVRNNGIKVIEEKVGGVYKAAGDPAKFKSIRYADVGHTYTPEMRKEMLAWFDRWLK